MKDELEKLKGEICKEAVLLLPATSERSMFLTWLYAILSEKVTLKKAKKARSKNA